MIQSFIKYSILAFIGSIAPAMVMNIEKRVLLWAGLGGMLGFCTAFAFNPSTLFFGMLQIFAGTLVNPSTVFCISGIFPLVPGISAYQTMKFLVENNLNKAAFYAVDTALKAFTIAFGIMIVTALFRFIRRTRRKEDKAREA